MRTHVAFLRGINLGGRRVKSADLCAPFGALGLRDPVAFRASGNVIFASDGQPEDELAPRIEKALEDALGYRVHVFVRSGPQVCSLAAAEPFDADALKASDGKLQVVMLAAEPSGSARRDVLAHASDEDVLALHGREIFWLPNRGVGRSELNWRAIERLVGPTTTRTMSTVQEIAAKHFTV